MTLTGDDPFGPHTLKVIGTATSNTAAGDRMPTTFALWQNRPNPFTRSTEIRYALPVKCPVSLEVFNLQGQRVATLVREDQEPGFYSVAFGSGAVASDSRRLSRLASGVYFYRFKAGSFASTRKMLVMR